VLDDFSRYSIAWKLCTTIKAVDVTDTLEQALSAAGLDRSGTAHRPRLLSDNGSSYIAGDLAVWVKGQGITHVRGAPNHPMTQGNLLAFRKRQIPPRQRLCRRCECRWGHTASLPKPTCSHRLRYAAMGSRILARDARRNRLPEPK
jgi:transposase InsO family protein